jgi:hypothetical protein
MAFTAANFISNEVANTNAGDIFQYKEAVTLATMGASGYFDLAAASYGLKNGDTILMIGTDGVRYSVMDVTSTVATVDYSSYVSSNAVSQVLVTGATLTPTTAQSGTTFILAKADGVAVTLPANAIGLKYKFVHGAPVLSSVGHIITTDSNDTTIQGSHCSGGVIALMAAEDTITFVGDGTSIIGDYIEIESDATNWYANGLGSTTQAVLGSDEA